MAATLQQMLLRSQQADQAAVGLECCCAGNNGWWARYSMLLLDINCTDGSPSIQSLLLCPIHANDTLQETLIKCF